MLTAVERAKVYSEERLGALRESVGITLPATAIGITVGSYARREASNESDLDYFVVTPEAGSDTGWASQLRNAIHSQVSKPPAAGGAFDAIVDRPSFLRNIGGPDDSNKTITHRMLFLLEGEWLSNDEGFRSLRSEMIGRYVQDALHDHKLALFLLNDIIRYWRTITVDYEQKTSGEQAKPWAIRKLKLTFSRKLLYAGGLFSVGCTADLTPERKRQTLEDLFARPALERVQHICGEALARPIVNSYNRFLGAIEDPETRKHLDKLSRGEADTDPVFRDFNNESHHYTRALLSAFESTFHSTHPIRRAVIF